MSDWGTIKGFTQLYATRAASDEGRGSQAVDSRNLGKFIDFAFAHYALAVHSNQEMRWNDFSAKWDLFAEKSGFGGTLEEFVKSRFAETMNYERRTSFHLVEEPLDGNGNFKPRMAEDIFRQAMKRGMFNPSFDRAFNP